MAPTQKGLAWKALLSLLWQWLCSHRHKETGGTCLPYPPKLQTFHLTLCFGPATSSALKVKMSVDSSLTEVYSLGKLLLSFLCPWQRTRSLGLCSCLSPNIKHLIWVCALARTCKEEAEQQLSRLAPSGWQLSLYVRTFRAAPAASIWHTPKCLLEVIVGKESPQLQHQWSNVSSAMDI